MPQRCACSLKDFAAWGRQLQNLSFFHEEQRGMQRCGAPGGRQKAEGSRKRRRSFSRAWQVKKAAKFTP
jgi:hypothetical protein